METLRAGLGTATAVLRAHIDTEYLSKSDVVAKGIRTLIQEGELLPGTVLRQRELAERFGVSPTPVREALRQLEAEGFVTNELHRGATVIRTEDARLQENFLIRAQLESLAASLAASKVTDEDLEQLDDLLERLAACPSDDPRRTDLNRRFHFAIYECARSPVLLSLLNLLWRSLDGGPRISRSAAESSTQHHELLEALRKREAGLAAEVTRRHILDAAAFSAAHVDDGPPTNSRRKARPKRPAKRAQ
ncbi:MAG TPA: GntR family transcriptional regulator [Acidimicrobiales bacterium]|nr:GntR family transcriptional regulator [Acidimicrobiales bacterium]